MYSFKSVAFIYALVLSLSVSLGQEGNVKNETAIMDGIQNGTAPTMTGSQKGTAAIMNGNETMSIMDGIQNGTAPTMNGSQNGTAAIMNGKAEPASPTRQRQARAPPPEPTARALPPKPSARAAPPRSSASVRSIHLANPEHVNQLHRHWSSATALDSTIVATLTNLATFLTMLISSALLLGV